MTAVMRRFTRSPPIEVERDHRTVQRKTGKVFAKVCLTVRLQPGPCRSAVQHLAKRTKQLLVVATEQLIPVLLAQFRRHVHVHEERQVQRGRAVAVLLEIDHNYPVRFLVFVVEQHIVAIEVTVQDDGVDRILFEELLHQLRLIRAILVAQNVYVPPKVIAVQLLRTAVDVGKQTLGRKTEHDVVAFEKYFPILYEVERDDFFHQLLQLRRIFNAHGVRVRMVLRNNLNHAREMGHIQVEPRTSAKAFGDHVFHHKKRLDHWAVFGKVPNGAKSRGRAEGRMQQALAGGSGRNGSIPTIEGSATKLPSEFSIFAGVYIAHLAANWRERPAVYGDSHPRADPSEDDVDGDSDENIDRKLDS
uniref:Uncharacterized protein n=1 Tax=Anopheles atroparvus TaxID=41427 RepID=A0A182IPX9_ANOAO